MVRKKLLKEKPLKMPSPQKSRDVRLARPVRMFNDIKIIDEEN